MRLLLLNLFVIFLVGSPLLVLESVRSRSKWIDEHHGGLSFMLWLLILGSVYIWVLPRLGLEPNWHFLAP
jgi:uncharacterized membrane protein